MKEKVNHPDHYHGKDNALEDLKKAKWYLEREINNREQ
jgi:hypothetical protein